MKISYKLVVSLVGMPLVVVLAGTLAFSSFKQIETSAEASKHTLAILNKADDLLLALRDAETGQRGYLLTGDEAFLQT